jgi:glucose-6-phosphate 1-dehydrogenase
MSDISEQLDQALSPAIFVIFGITGDLAQRKLLPAIYHLFKENLLHEDTVILGITRREVTAQELLSKVELCVNEIDNICDPVALKAVESHLQMHTMSMTDPADYAELLKLLNKIEADKGLCMDRLYYLSIPPQIFGPIVRNLGEQGLNASCNHGKAATRLLVEKPFGYDLHSAQELIKTTGEWFGEDQLFRIDHYLAKETVQNILTFRQQNALFASLWNDKSITAIEITAAEKIGIEARATFYEQTGALRDFIQSHLIQLLAVVTMDEPAMPTSEAIHTAKAAVLEQIEPLTALTVTDSAWRGQYNGYTTEVGKDDSFVETYAAIQLKITSSRWQNTKITLATGKSLADKKTEVKVYFKHETAEVSQNVVTFRIQPDEGISIQINAKQPGFDNVSEPVTMDFSYKNAFNDNGHPDAYERVLVDAVRGDHTLFSTADEVLGAWRAVQAVVEAWEKSNSGLNHYKIGTAMADLPPFSAAS